MDFIVTLEKKIDAVVQHIERLVTKFHRTYLVLIGLFALIGYTFVLLFPALALLSINSLYEALIANGDINWKSVFTWLLTLLLSVQLSYRMFITRPVPAVGFTMPESKIPRVYEVIDQVQSHFKRPVIHRVIISANYELDIVKTPRWMLPVWSSNTLVIGLPLMICLSPEQFEHMLARRIGQYSKQNNMMTNWIYQLNGIWQQYSYIYSKQKSIESLILKLFYTMYSALYKKFSVYAARSDEFNADAYAMEMYSHDVICEMITADAFSRWYLEKRFWPAIEKANLENHDAMTQPYRKLTTVIKNNLKIITPDMLIKLARDEVIERKNRYPSLQQRLERIGHAKPCMNRGAGESAADYYLAASLNGALNLMDKLWYKKLKKKLNKKKIFNKGWMPAFKNG
ncbi:MAG: hypothetical protein OQK98_15410 [Gammaproteobacteria bacterium]|nr:hypothetical protein [Gammaproteobacteria bacterium]